jgi:hypothetical protein
MDPNLKKPYNWGSTLTFPHRTLSSLEEERDSIDENLAWCNDPSEWASVHAKHVEFCDPKYKHLRDLLDRAIRQRRAWGER